MNANKIIRGIAYIYLALAVLIILASLLMILINQGFWGLAATLSPFNIINWLLTGIVLFPGVALLMWVDKRENQ